MIEWKEMIGLTIAAAIIAAAAAYGIIHAPISEFPIHISFNLTPTDDGHYRVENVTADFGTPTPTWTAYPYWYEPDPENGTVTIWYDCTDGYGHYIMIYNTTGMPFYDSFYDSFNDTDAGLTWASSDDCINWTTTTTTT